MHIPFRNALRMLPILAASHSLQAATLTDASTPVLGAEVSSATSGQHAANAQLLLQIQQLQQEMQMLRNVVERQQKAIVQLQKDGRDRYLDADRRLTDLSQQLSDVKNQKTPASSSDQSSGLPVVSGTAKEAYQAAYALVKQQKFDQAITAYQGFIKNYPDSSLQPNAYYWLGELYMVKDLTQEAERVFRTVVETYPKSLKVPDASYKLGLVFARYGQMDKAKAQMNEVKSKFPKTTASKLADQFLDTQK
ncbi:tol-pal system protein YbgF [Oceanospirillum linum]|uniref:Cell division coordinator CpoB n=1 Tax=Oceanospirillum linum TaxID=966 RepID=A0A1T1HCN5_OCELI|nr:tol-pal system protein YbgF [Oceanospirillum linum]SEF92162.1 tol-pal system protein YbgF [Oleiphilus messinensis]SMP12788.1 tol-pal system protein YbgF [Oceanospirillum linum]